MPTQSEAYGEEGQGRGRTISYLFTDGASFGDGLDVMTRNVLSNRSVGAPKKNAEAYEAGYRAAISEAGAIARTVPASSARTFGRELAFTFDAIKTRIADSGSAFMLNYPPTLKTPHALSRWYDGFRDGMENAAYVARAAEFQTTEARR